MKYFIPKEFTLGKEQHAFLPLIKNKKIKALTEYGRFNKNFLNNFS